MNDIVFSSAPTGHVQFKLFLISNPRLCKTSLVQGTLHLRLMSNVVSSTCYLRLK